MDTRAGAKGDQVLLVLHLELRDRFGEQVRDLGKLRVELGRPGAPATTWELDQMIFSEENVKRYDPSTRTYRFGLSLPPGTPSGGKVKAVYHMPQAQRTLSHEYTLETAR